MRVGVLGCGYWGPNLVRNLFATGRCSTIECFDASPKAMAKVLGQFGGVVPATNVEALIEECDAVVVATPVKSHHALAREALRAGKAVFVEKPLTASVAESLDLVELATRKHVPLMTGHTFLYSPAVRKIRQYIEDGTLGDIHYLTSSRENLGTHRADVNVLWDLAPHDLSMLLYWLQEAPRRVAAFGRACVGRHIDFASLHLEFPSGTAATVGVSWLAPHKLRRMVVSGKQRMVIYDDTASNEKIKLCDSGASLVEAPASFGEYQLTYRNGDILSPRLETKEPLLAEMNAFLDWVEHGIEPEANVWIALQVVATLEAACRSLQENGRLVEVASSRFEARSVQTTPAAAAVAGD
ncbi:MAG TPA: Gfo/Idh/MocA family oxidoreductase [Candidatus Koribacter sp.]|jgi:predicted dehydrogenase